MGEITVGKARSAADWAAMREICWRTSARPVPPARREAFGRRWIGPYEAWAPGWAYVARAGRDVVGYLTGCPSTARLALQCALFGPALPLGANLRFSPAVLARLLWSCPAHLHVNVDEGHRGGTGRALVERFESDLRKAGVGGVHVFCGEGPLGFYRKLGYAPLARLELGQARIHALGKRLAA